jgi:hypothetical protein
VIQTIMSMLSASLRSLVRTGTASTPRIRTFGSTARKLEHYLDADKQVNKVSSSLPYSTALSRLFAAGLSITIPTCCKTSHLSFLDI